MAVMYILIIIGLISTFLGANILAFNKGTGREIEMPPLVLFITGILLVLACTISVSGDLKEMKGTKLLEEDVKSYLTNHYQVKHPDSLTVTELSEDNLYKIQLLSGKQEIIKLKISEHEVTGIEVIDSSETLKKPS